MATAVPSGPDDHGGDPSAERLVSLDLVRGIAVLGILAINVAGFAGPRTGVTSPCRLAAPGPCEQASFALAFVLFEGKMRALFAMLFGAGIGLFQDNAEKRGAARRGALAADALQARRLCWLIAFGLLHYVLLWWGDILFVYGCCGLMVLAVSRSTPVQLGTLAAMLALAGFGWTLASDFPLVLAEEMARTGHAAPAQTAAVRDWYDWLAARDRGELALYRSGFSAIVRAKVVDEPLWLVSMVLASFTEIVPLMLTGLLLYRGGLFAGTWRRARLAGTGLALLVPGLLLTLAALAWLWPRHLPFIAMALLLGDGLMPAHLLMALGYLALLVAAAPALATTAPGRWLVCAGRMAFSNYIASSVMMTALFYGWGLGRFGTIGPDGQWLCVLVAWAAMLAWSPLWLARYRRGPLEWLWRSLTEARLLPNRRH